MTPRKFPTKKRTHRTRLNYSPQVNYLYFNKYQKKKTETFLPNQANFVLPEITSWIMKIMNSTKLLVQLLASTTITMTTAKTHLTCHPKNTDPIIWSGTVPLCYVSDEILDLFHSGISISWFFCWVFLSFFPLPKSQIVLSLLDSTWLFYSHKLQDWKRTT